jgi:peroxiredoxin Q/BCP
MTLTIGDQAPDFALPSDANETIRLQDLRGKKVVLYFYPKDNTPGCTRESCDFRDSLGAFSAENTVILGISRDTPEKHQKFKAKYQLPFPLLADVDGIACEAYGTLGKKTIFGRSIFGIQRATFLINEQGKLQAIWRKVKVTGHIKQVLDELNKA